MSLSNEERAELNQLKKELSALRETTIRSVGDLARIGMLSAKVSVHFHKGEQDDAFEAVEELSNKIGTLTDRLMEFIESDYGRYS